MTTRKHNEFLDADDSEDDQSQGYDSEIEDVKKGGRSSKRRKVESDLSDEDEDEPLENSGVDKVDETKADQEAESKIRKH